jgi:hypothetical protein
MAARVTKRFWEIGDIVNVLEAWEAKSETIGDSFKSRGTVRNNSCRSAEMDADTLLHTYDAGSPEQKTAVEQTVLTAESALREASSTIVLQRNEFGLYCPPVTGLTANSLIEMIRREVSRTKFVGRYHFDLALLHALQADYPCPPQSK